MAELFLCPDVVELERFSVGNIPDTEAELVERHLATCPDCIQTIDNLHARDTLIDAFKGQATLIDRPRTAEPVQTLIHRLKVLHPGASAADTHTTGGATPPPAIGERASFDFLAPSQELDEMGRLGPYRILRVLGVGGMGIVFEAEDCQLQRLVALKVLHPALAMHGAHRRRFLREAQAAAALAHDHVVPIYQVGEDRGIPFLAMQLLEGETLESRLRRVGRLPPAEAARISGQVAAALAAAHERGLIHRDIKPGNIWLEAAGDRVKILDFGLVRAAEDDVHLTDPGVFVGTPLWVAPEQAEGRAVDCRADLFSLGSVLYAMCTGRPPFEAQTNMGVLRRVCDATPLAVDAVNPAVPSWLAAVVAKLHAKDPPQRFQSAAEVAALLRDPSQGGQKPPADDAEPKSVAVRKKRLRLPWLAAAVLLLSAAGLGLTEATGITQLTTRVASLLGSGGSQGGDDTAPGASTNQEGQAQPAAPANVPRAFPTAVFAFEERAGAKDYAAKVNDLFFAKMAAKPDLVLVDRGDLKKALDEQALNLSGTVERAAAVRVGQLTGAKVLVSGSVLVADKKIYLVARILGTETGRVLGADVAGKTSDELGPLVEKLADTVANTIAERGPELVAKALAKKDRLAELQKKLKAGKRPTLMIKIAERHVGQTSFDPAAQTELVHYARALGFEVIDPQGAVGKADVIISGEGISEFAARHGTLVSVRARVELKVVDRKTDRILAADRQTAIAVDLAEQIAAKTALEDAAALLAERVLPQLVTP
jgi:TolB-like protein